MKNKGVLLLAAILVLVVFVGLFVHAEGNRTGNDNISSRDDNESSNDSDDDREELNGSDDDSEENETENECEWRCGKWEECVNGTSTRTCSNPLNCTGEEPKLNRMCVGFNFSKDKVCCKSTETDDNNKTKIEYEWEDRTECLETDEDDDGEAKDMVGKNFCAEDIREECEYDSVKERAKCRYENRNRFGNFSDFQNDSCEGLRNEGLCVALYVRSQNCFGFAEGEKRDRCFKQVAEFKQHQIDKEVNESENKTEAREKVRKYMVLVLENLQKRVEKAVNNSKLTAEQGATLTEKIIEIKQAILDGATKEEIKSQIQELKDLWKTYKAGEADE